MVRMYQNQSNAYDLDREFGVSSDAHIGSHVTLPYRIDTILNSVSEDHNILVDRSHLSMVSMKGRLLIHPYQRHRYVSEVVPKDSSMQF